MPERFLKAEDLPNDPDKLVELYKEQVSYLHFDRNKQQEIQDKLGSLKDPETGKEVSIWEYSERLLTEDQKVAKAAFIDFFEYEEIDWSNIELIRMEAFILELDLPKDELVDGYFSKAQDEKETEVSKVNETILKPQPQQQKGEGKNTFQQQGEIWRITFQGNETILSDQKGFHYIAYLLDYPKREIDATDLYKITEKQTAPSTPYSGIEEEQLEKEGMVSLPEIEDPLPASDNKSKKILDERLEKIKEEKEEAESFQNWDRVEELEEEILQYLGSNFGLKGKPRKTGSANKARVNVTRAIDRALEKIEESLPALGSHLRSSIRTGYQCNYRPDGDTPIFWE